VEKRFEQVDKRFEAMQQSMDKRFDELTRRIDKFMRWSFGLTVTATGILIDRHSETDTLKLPS